MSNLGLRARARRPTASSVVETPVGDRNVLDELERRNLTLGGEQSGHVIYADHATTGDGALTGIFLLDTMARRGRSLSELAVGRHPGPAGAPQRRGRRRRRARTATPRSGAACATSTTSSATTAGCSCGPSGTEPLVRVMVEAHRPRRGGSRRPTASWTWSSTRRPRPRIRPPVCRISRSCVGSSASSAGARRAPCPTPPTWCRRSIAPWPAFAGRAEHDAASTGDLTGHLDAAAGVVESVDAALRGVPGVRALLGDPQAALLIEDRIEQLTSWFDALERELDDGLGGTLAPGVARGGQRRAGARTRRGVGRRARPVAHRPRSRRRSPVSASRTRTSRPNARRRTRRGRSAASRRSRPAVRPSSMPARAPRGVS